MLFPALYDLHCAVSLVGNVQTDEQEREEALLWLYPVPLMEYVFLAAHKTLAKIDALCLINRNYSLSTASHLQPNSCNGYIS